MKISTRSLVNLLVLLVIFMVGATHSTIAIADGPAIAICTVGGQQYECADKLPPGPWQVSGSYYLVNCPASASLPTTCNYATIPARSFDTSDGIYASFLSVMQSAVIANQVSFMANFANYASCKGAVVMSNAADQVAYSDTSDAYYDRIAWSFTSNPITPLSMTVVTGGSVGPQCLTGLLETAGTGGISLQRPKPSCPSGFTPSGTNGFPASDSPCLRLLCNCSLDTQYGNPITLGGAKKEYEVDFESPNPLLSITRYYDSTLRQPDATGNARRPTWRWSFESKLIIGPNYVVALRPSGTRVVFSTAVPASEYYSTNYGNFRLTPSGSGWILYDGDRLETFNSSGSLSARWSMQGQKVSFGYSARGQVTAINDDFGRHISAAYYRADDDKDSHAGFVVNDVPVIQNIGLPDGSSIQYEVPGDLPELYSVTIGGVVQKRYQYDTYLQLTASLDNGIFPYSLYGYSGPGRYATVSYRSDGAFSIPTNLSPTVLQTTVQTPNEDLAGNAANSDVTIANVAGVMRVTKQTQAAGAGCAASSVSMAYDANGNVASATDFNGNQVCSTFDLSRNLESARVEGLASTARCTDVTPANAALPTGSRKTSLQWHPQWRVETKTATPGRIVTNIYNGQPDPFNGNAIASCAPSSALLPDGTPIAVLCKRVEQATTDTDGHLGFTATLQAGVAPRQQSWTYNQYGQVLTAKGSRTDVLDTTTYQYYGDTTSQHTAGDLQSTTNAVGQVVQFTQYDPNGLLLQSIDPNGVVTVNTYDSRQRLLTSTVGGQTTTRSYDVAGQLTRIAYPDGNYTSYGYGLTNAGGYDDSHRLLSVSDSLGNQIVYTRNGAGQPTVESVKDPSGTLVRQITRKYDGLGRAYQVIGTE